ncbi:hypothetical protein BJ170DRAFT_639781 [Xylariales sp. AK1849]|nr:hypothetical protein BJ170DRAFT_639781 [Xylariales sp. AK1849]
MATDSRSVPGMPAPYGHACADCAKSKCKCIYRGIGNCERCHRRGLECRPSDAVRKRSTRKTASVSRTSHLEERLEDIVKLLQSQQTANGAPRTHVPGSATGLQSLDAGRHSQYDEDPCLASNTSQPAIPTPPMTIASSASYTPGPAPSNLDDELSPREAEDMLDNFRTHYLTSFPFMWIKSDRSAQDIRREQPFLWLNIRVACSKSTSQIHLLGDKIRETLARRVFVDLERNMDLLLGLLVFIGWFGYHGRGKSLLCRYVNVANSLVSDLRLVRPFDLHGTADYFCSKPRAHEQTSEDRRAVLGTFIVASTVSNFLRVDVTRWSTHMDDCLQKLAENPEYPGDELLVATTRARLLAEDVIRSSWRRGDYEATGASAIYVKPLRTRLQHLKCSLSPELAQNKVLLSHIHNSEALINEIAIFHPPSPVIQPQVVNSFPSLIPIPALNFTKPTSSTNLSNPMFKIMDIPRLELLHSCLEAVKLSISVYLSFTPAEYPSFPFAVLCHLAHSIQMLYRLSMLDEPDWDRAAVRRSADIVAVLHEAGDKLGQVGAAAHIVHDGGLDIFTRGEQTMRTTAALWGASLAQTGVGTNNGMAPPALAESGGPEHAENGADTAMPMTLDFGNDAWLIELLASWES